MTPSRRDRQSSRNDELRCQDIRDAIARIQSWSEKERDDLYRSGVVRQMEIIGEAAHMLSRGFVERHSEVDWKGLTDLRNRLAHQYFDQWWAQVERIVLEQLPRVLGVIAGVGSDSVVLDSGAQLVSDALSEADRRPALFQQPIEASAAPLKALCGAWMRIARAHCLLPAGHRPADHHRSRL